jgi:diguanylate cyclase (GGDEF)-like protein/PAS domain S-box-containing protein
MNSKLPQIFKAFGSLKVRLTLAGSLALAVGIGSSVTVLLHKAEGDTVRESLADEVTEAVRAASQLQHRLIGQQRALRVAGQRLTPAILASPERLRDFLDANVVLREEVSSLWLAAPNGKIHLIADPLGVRTSDRDLADRAYFQRAVSQGRPIVSEVVMSRVSAEPAIFLVQPLVAHDQVFGVLGAGLRLQSHDLMASITDTVQENESVLVVVTDSAGTILAHPKRDKVGTSILGEPRLAKTFARWTEAGKPVEPSGIDLHDGDSVVAIAGVPGPDWVIWRHRSRQDLLAPLVAGRMDAMRWAAAIVVTLAAALSACLWWMLQPLSRLERRAKHLFDGSFDAQAGWPAARGEVGSLQRVLRHVAAERAQLEAFNNQVLYRLKSVMASAPVGIAFTRARRFELVSAEYCRLFGRDESEFLGQPTTIAFTSIDEVDAVEHEARTAFSEGRHYSCEQLLRRGDGESFWARLFARPVDANDIEAGTIWTVRDITDEIASRRALEWSATHDMLTGLSNRRAFETRIAQVFSARPRSMPAALILFDLDRFKPINDSEGHAAGDAVLKAVARASSEAVRAGDLVVRLGGDEFAVVLERCPMEAALRVAECVRAAVGAIALPWRNEVLSVGASVGVAMLAENIATAEAWIAEADLACYEAKADGRNTVRLAPASRQTLERVRRLGT